MRSCSGTAPQRHLGITLEHLLQLPIFTLSLLELQTHSDPHGSRTIDLTATVQPRLVSLSPSLPPGLSKLTFSKRRDLNQQPPAAAAATTVRLPSCPLLLVSQGDELVSSPAA